MGNPAWGHGYHKGFGDGAKQGSLIGSLVTLGVGGLIAGGAWAIGKLRDRSAARAADRDEATTSESAAGEGRGDDAEDFGAK